MREGIKSFHAKTGNCCNFDVQKYARINVVFFEIRLKRKLFILSQ